jgi:hypothetical protein
MSETRHRQEEIREAPDLEHGPADQRGNRPHLLLDGHVERVGLLNDNSSGALSRNDWAGHRPTEYRLCVGGQGRTGVPPGCKRKICGRFRMEAGIQGRQKWAQDKTGKKRKSTGYLLCYATKVKNDPNKSSPDTINIDSVRDQKVLCLAI